MELKGPPFSGCAESMTFAGPAQMRKSRERSVRIALGPFFDIVNSLERSHAIIQIN